MLLGSCCGSIALVSLHKAIDTTFGIDDLLLTSVEGMAIAADFNTDLIFGGTHLYRSSAHACGNNFMVLGVNSFLHDGTLLDI